MTLDRYNSMQSALTKTSEELADIRASLVHLSEEVNTLKSNTKERLQANTTAISPAYSPGLFDMSLKNLGFLGFFKKRKKPKKSEFRFFRFKKIKFNVRFKFLSFFHLLYN